ncbi:hypothetical protein CEXT_251231 [Caerostris extrusa]|uniref:Uncharacterized protein n=1 Tax=Caerostris extrusa TaxID=172846 RepID=A0AAV4VXY9_CAEEX|nr:hypothetical protein CEXT_251231 [Caerostris extrusa]
MNSPNVAKFRNCLISVDSTIHISPVNKPDICCNSIHKLEELCYTQKCFKRWNFLLLKMKNKEIKSEFINMIFSKYHGSALINFSNINSFKNNITDHISQKMLNTQSLVTILFPDLKSVNIDYTCEIESICNDPTCSTYTSEPVINCIPNSSSHISTHCDAINGDVSCNHLTKMQQQEIMLEQPLNLSVKECEAEDSNKHCFEENLPLCSPCTVNFYYPDLKNTSLTSCLHNSLKNTDMLYESTYLQCLDAQPRCNSNYGPSFNNSYENKLDMNLIYMPMNVLPVEKSFINESDYTNIPVPAHQNSISPLLNTQINKSDPKIFNSVEDIYLTPASSPKFIVVDDADCSSDEDVNSLRSNIDTLCQSLYDDNSS